MKLRDVRKLGIKHCNESDSNYTYISYNDSDTFYLSDKEDAHTVFLVNKNGSLSAYRDTKYADDFHRELRRRKNRRKKNGKRKINDMCNQSFEYVPEEIEMAD